MVLNLVCFYKYIIYNILYVDKSEVDEYFVFW